MDCSAWNPRWHSGGCPLLRFGGFALWLKPFSAASHPGEVGVSAEDALLFAGMVGCRFGGSRGGAVMLW